MNDFRVYYGLTHKAYGDPVGAARLGPAGSRRRPPPQWRRFGGLDGV